MRAASGGGTGRQPASGREGPVDLRPGPSGRPAPRGTCGQAVGDTRASPAALPTLAGLSPTSPTGQRQQPFRSGFGEGVADAPAACSRIAGVPHRRALRQGLRGDGLGPGTEEETNLSNTA